MRFHIVITGLHSTDNATDFTDVIQYIEAYLKETGIPYHEVYVERQENV
jgi:hypothetical protein